ncbi:hypothetical protein B0J17DRAFT_714678 [Rhizoctonia solani]|nr:hypothetical protein B0J17DRAFT_714678 [Rhizoctonia solani]
MLTLSHPLDTEDPITDPTLCNSPIVNTLVVNVYNKVGTRVIGCPSLEEHTSRPQLSNARVVPPQDEWRIVRIIIAGIVVVAIVCLWKYSRISTHSKVRNRSSRQGGRSEAVAVTGVPPPPEASHQPGGNSGNPQLRHRRPATVVSAELPSYHVPPPRQATDPFILLGKEPDELDNSVIANPQRPNNAFQSVIVAGHRILKAWGWALIDQLQPEPATVHPPIRLPSPRSLHRSLYTGTRDLGENFLALGECIFLLVGFDTPGQRDAENDTKYLRQMFESALPSIPRFECIYGADATYAKIRETVLALLGEARTMSGPSRMLLLFTGTGDARNAMYLSNGEVLSESDLSQWLSASPVDQINMPHIGALFDICRMAVSKLAMVFRSVELAWSCSAGEYAYAIHVSQDRLIPRSIFLLSIFLAAHDMKAHGLNSCYFEAAFAFHIKQLSALILFMYHRDHQSRCARCPARKRCDPPVAQNPDLQQAGCAITSLGMIIATYFPQHACEVFLAVEYKMMNEGFTGRLCPLSVLRAKQSDKPTIKDAS